jgi:hypothetical protein
MKIVPTRFEFPKRKPRSKNATTKKAGTRRPRRVSAKRQALERGWKELLRQWIEYGEHTAKLMEPILLDMPDAFPLRSRLLERLKELDVFVRTCRLKRVGDAWKTHDSLKVQITMHKQFTYILRSSQYVGTKYRKWLESRDSDQGPKLDVML